jgi:hypothetical protein
VVADAVVEDVLVDADLMANEFQAAVEVLALVQYARFVLEEEFEPLGLGACARAHERGIAAHVAQRHARSAQDEADRQPIDVVLGVDPAAAEALERPGEQAFAPVEAQGMDA